MLFLLLYRVAVVAGSGRVVTGLDPAIVLGPHYVTVGACRGIIFQIGISFGVDKGVTAYTDGDSDEQRE